jgi:hypothetical protein
VNFIKNHLVPIAHSVLANLIWALILAVIISGAVLTIIKPLRNSAFSTVKVPAWLIVLIIIFCIFLLIRSWIRKRIKIRSANYGHGAFQPDVTNRVRAHIRRGVLDVLATTDELRDGNDPAPEHTKALAVNYILHGRERTVYVIEGSRLILP